MDGTFNAQNNVFSSLWDNSHIFLTFFCGKMNSKGKL